MVWVVSDWVLGGLWQFTQFGGQQGTRMARGVILEGSRQASLQASWLPNPETTRLATADAAADRGARRHHNPYSHKAALD